MALPSKQASGAAVLCSILALLPSLASVAHGATLNVPSPAYPTIQSAINAAVDNDQVVVAPGTYYENVSFLAKAITVRSTSPDDPATVKATIIHGQSLGTVVAFTAGATNASVLSGFTIKQGKAPCGGGVYCDGASPTITKNAIISNTAIQDGGGICCVNGSSPLISANTISRNAASGDGGGIYCGSECGPTVSGNTIAANRGKSSTRGQAICCASNSHPTIDDNRVNRHSVWGIGTIYCGPGSRPVITANTIRANSPSAIVCEGSAGRIARCTIVHADCGNGIECRAGARPTVMANSINENYSAGISCNDSSPTITGNAIRRNGMAIACTGASPKIIDNTIIDNTGVYPYGAIHCVGGSSPAITGNRILNNGSPAYWGGGIYCKDTGTNPEISGNVITGNRTFYDGGGIYISGGACPTISSNLISGNSSGTKGGALFYDGGGAGITVDHNIFSGNTATERGGGVYATGHVTLVNDTFDRNQANHGGGIWAQGASVVVRNCIVGFSTGGGGIHSGGPPPTVSYCDVFGNTGGDYVNMADPTGSNGNIKADPLFADAPDDYHEKSEGGRWDPVTSTWVIDDDTSPCTNAGDPNDPYDAEPEDNGDCINMGRWGNTTEASKTPPAPLAAGIGPVVLTSLVAVPTRTGGAQVVLGLTSAATVRAEVLNVAGRPIAIITRGMPLKPGTHALQWSGRTATGLTAPGGTYLVRVEALSADGTLSRRLAALSLAR